MAIINTLPFGKYKGEYIHEVDTGYLDWLIGEAWFQEKFPLYYKKVEEELNTRQDWLDGSFDEQMPDELWY